MLILTLHFIFHPPKWVLSFQEHLTEFKRLKSAFEAPLQKHAKTIYGAVTRACFSSASTTQRGSDRRAGDPRQPPMLLP